MNRLVATILANALGLWLADRFIAGFELSGGVAMFILAAALLSVINWVVRPVVKFFTWPIIIITLGLFLIVINMAMLWLLDIIMPALLILNLGALLWATLLMGVLNILTYPIRKTIEKSSSET